MRTFGQLIGPEQVAAVEFCLTSLLRAIIEGGLRFNDALNEDDLQARIDLAFTKAEDMQTPWFVTEYIMETRYFPGDGRITEADGLWPVSEALRGMATCDAEDAQYADADEGPIFRLTSTLGIGGVEYKVRAA